MRKGGNSPELKLMFDEYDAFTPSRGNWRWRDRTYGQEPAAWELRRLRVRLGALTKVVTRNGHLKYHFPFPGRVIRFLLHEEASN